MTDWYTRTDTLGSVNASDDVAFEFSPALIFRDLEATRSGPIKAARTHNG